MQPGGIQFAVTAVAEGMAESVSDVFVYERNLDAISQIVYDEDSQSFYWTAVQGASKYIVTVTNNGTTRTVDIGSATSYCVKSLSGNIDLSVMPVTKGYNSPEATAAHCNKTSLATTENIRISGTTVSWDAVAGATEYMVKVNNQSFRRTETAVDLETLIGKLDNSTIYEISVMAVGAENSLYSDVVTTGYGGQYCYYNCGNLTEIKAYRVTVFNYNDDGTVRSYADPTPVKRNSLLTAHCFEGCYKLDVMALYDLSGMAMQTYMENVFAGFPNPVLLLSGSLMFWQTDADLVAFANTPDLKEVWMNPTELDLNAATFSNVAGELKVIFYNHTYEEIVRMMKGKTAWYEDASKLVTFYFKDTIPEDMVWPEELQP